jgi:hypothetical protein
MEVDIDYEQHSGTQNEIVINELSIDGDNVIHTFQFLSRDAMRPNGDP